MKMIKARSLFRILCLVLLLSMGMAAHVQAGTKSVTLTVGQKKKLSVKKSWKRSGGRAASRESSPSPPRARSRQRKPGKRRLPQEVGRRSRNSVSQLKKARSGSSQVGRPSWQNWRTIRQPEHSGVNCQQRS